MPGRTRLRSMKRTASATGATTSAPNTGNWRGSASSSPTLPFMPTPPRRPNASARTSPNNSDCETRTFSSGTTTARTSLSASSRDWMCTQVRDVIDRNRGAAGIVYSLRRKDADEMTAYLKAAKYRAVPYHAGMASDERRQSQEAFAAEDADVVVATVAFGMGIDRSNVRFVVHAAMPKTHRALPAGRYGRGKPRRDSQRPSACCSTPGPISCHSSRSSRNRRKRLTQRRSTRPLASSNSAKWLATAAVQCAGTRRS